MGGTTNNGLALLASPALQAQLVYPNATDVVVKSTGLNFVVPGLNNNQTSLANALNSAGHTYGLGGPVFNFLLNDVTSAAGYNAVLNQLTGEAATGAQQTTFDAMKMFMGTMLDPSNRGTTSAPGGGATGYASEGDASAYAADGRQRPGAERDAYAMFTKAPLAQSYDPRWSVWAAGFGGSQTTDGNATVGSNNTTSSVYGTAVGADYILSPRTIAGFALAGGGTNFSVAGSGSGHSDLFQAGAFVKHTVGAAYISAALAYGWQEITTNRTVTAAGTNQLRAQFDANAFSGRLEGGYRFVAPWVGGIGITPYAAAQFTTFDLPVMPSRPLSARMLLHSPITPRTSPTRAPNSASAPTNPLRCETAFSRCADAWPGRMTSIPIARSHPRSSRCLVQASSSTVRRRLPTPRWSQRQWKKNGSTAGRLPPPSRVSSPTSRGLTPARAWCDTRGELFTASS